MSDCVETSLGGLGVSDIRVLSCVVVLFLCEANCCSCCCFSERGLRGVAKGPIHFESLIAKFFFGNFLLATVGDASVFHFSTLKLGGPNVTKRSKNNEFIAGMAVKK